MVAMLLGSQTVDLTDKCTAIKNQIPAMDSRTCLLRHINVIREVEGIANNRL